MKLARGGRLLRHFAKRYRLVVLLGQVSVLAPVLVGRWLNATKRGGAGARRTVPIAGNLDYVGATDAAAFLITGPEGHIVLGGGYPSTAPMIMASIAKLGFNIKDVRVLLNAERHPDHAGPPCGSGSSLIRRCGWREHEIDLSTTLVRTRAGRTSRPPLWSCICKTWCSCRALW